MGILIGAFKFVIRLGVIPIFMVLGVCFAMIALLSFFGFLVDWAFTFNQEARKSKLKIFGNLIDKVEEDSKDVIK